MLTINHLRAGYGEVNVLEDVELSQEAGEVLVVLGRNGAGKTTLLKAIMGLVDRTHGTIEFEGRAIHTTAAYDIARLGLAYVPQGRRLFPQMTVRENLLMGIMAGGQTEQKLRQTVDLFPEIEDRLTQLAGTLSGGQQQMVAMARALCANPRLLLLDEPSEGLMPTLVKRVLETVARLRQNGVAVLLVEQKTHSVLRYADRVVLMENGKVVHVGQARQLQDDDALIRRYVGVQA